MLDQTHREQPLLEPPLEHPGLQRKTYNPAFMHEACQVPDLAIGKFLVSNHLPQKSAF
jgi:hypothetical protein